MFDQKYGNVTVPEEDSYVYYIDRLISLYFGYQQNELYIYTPKAIQSLYGSTGQGLQFNNELIQINQLYNFIAMSIMYQNKTYKGPTLEYEQKPAKQTTCFASKKQRFNYKVQKSPGPGSYQYQTTNYKTPQYHVKKDLDRQSPIKREHQWIWGSDRLSYVTNHNYSAYIGPGSYNLGVAGRGTGHTNWGKSQRFYYSKNGDYMTAPGPGPGAYESQGSKQKRNFGSVFKSKSPRTFIEKLLSQSSMPELKKSEMAQFIQNPQMSEKSLDQSQSKQKQVKQKKLKNSVFASKIPRFAQNNHNSNENIGPGSYQVPELSKSRSKQKLPKIIIIKGQERKRKIVKQDSQLPGPGSYDLNMKTIQKQLQGKRSVVICNQPRFAEKTEKMPGPGQYLENKKNALRAQFQKSQKLSPEKPSFNSSSERSPPELPTKSNPLCAYNLEYFDLQYRIKKSKEHLQKLKIMQVTIPAFNSKAKR